MNQRSNKYEEPKFAPPYTILFMADLEEKMLKTNDMVEVHR